MKVWIVEAEHPVVPGLHLNVFASREGAVKQAIAEVAMMPGEPVATPETWEKIVEDLQEDYGAGNTYVGISEHEVQS